ncbi:hypothetical protein ACJX0J_023566, partial [Zea mays]
LLIASQFKKTEILFDQRIDTLLWAISKVKLIYFTRVRTFLYFSQTKLGTIGSSNIMFFSFTSTIVVSDKPHL